MNFLNFLSQKASFKLGWGSQKGFSLVELMVVVAIIGILASIAIPNYQKFRRKAQQGSAKSVLSGIFMAERVFSTEWSFGGTSFAQIGFEQEGTNFYNAGWHSTTALTGAWNASNSTATNITLYKGPKVVTGATDYETGGSLGGAIALNHGGYNSCECVDGTANQCASPGVGCELTLSSATPPVATCPKSVSSHDNSCNVITGLIVPGNGTTRTSVDTFTIGAGANLGATPDDLWTIDQSKNLVNVQSGL